MIRALLLTGFYLFVGTAQGVAADAVRLISEFSDTTTVDGAGAHWSFRATEGEAGASALASPLSWTCATGSM